MQNVVPLGGFVKRQEYEVLEARVKALEKALEAVRAAEVMDHLPAPNLAVAASKAGFFIGCSASLLDLQSDPTSSLLQSEYSIIQCPQAAIPTGSMIITPTGPGFDFSKFTEVLEFCHRNSTRFKDGPYIDYASYRHDPTLTLQQLGNWVKMRLQKKNFAGPHFLEVLGNFISKDGEIVISGNQKLSPEHIIYHVSAVLDSIQSESAIGVSVNVPTLATIEATPDIRKLFDFLQDVISKNLGLYFVSLNTKVDLDSGINRQVLLNNLEMISSTGISEIHISNFAVTDKSNTGKNPSPYFEEFIDTIGQCDAIGSIEMRSPRQINPAWHVLFNAAGNRTDCYTAAQRAFWRLSC